MLVTFVIHTIALVSRIYISGRPPVTNLYSAAIFIGWGGVLLGIMLEVVYRLGIGNIIAGAIGFSTLLVADKLAAMAIPSPCCKPCSTRSSGWPRT